jgi:exosortase
MKVLPLPLSRPLLFNLALLAFFWLLLFNRIHTEWIVNDLYSYGWAVPFLAIYLFMERWRDRPAPAAKRPHPAWLILPIAVVLAYAPIRLINEANPDWVKINVYMTTTVAALSFAALFAIGRIRYMWHFAFPIFFIYTALPWPVAVEENIVQTLTRWNTAISADTLTMCGIPAMHTGNLIQIGNQWVNVAEACSGIRSLQTSFMMSLFLGEFYRLGPIARVLLMLSSFLVAFLLNVGRTTTLTYIAGKHGSEEMEKWHDHVGTAVMILCLAGLWFVALGFDKWKQKQDAAKPAPAPQPQHPPIPVPFPTAFVVFAVIALIAAEVTTESWYRYHEAKLRPPADWNVRWPAEAPKFKPGEFPDRTRAILKYNEAETASWITEKGYHFQMYYIRWHPGRVSKFLSGAHYPTVCLPATGLVDKGQTGKFSCPTDVLDIPFTTFLFAAGDDPVYVFHAIIEDQVAPDAEKIDYRQVDSSERIDSVMRGHRNLGQRVVGISIRGATSQHEAETTVYEILSNIIKTSPTKTAAIR